MKRTRLVVLKRVLEAVKIVDAIGSAAGRKTAQDMLFLLQVGGLPLDYDFQWVSDKPYSKNLNQDLKELAESEDSRDSHQLDLATHFEEKLRRAKRILSRPMSVGFSRPRWHSLLVACVAEIDKGKRTDLARASFDRHLSADQAGCVDIAMKHLSSYLRARNSA